MTRTQLIAAVRALQTERDRAITRAKYWRDRHDAACRHLNQHACDDRCWPCEHDDCEFDSCACDCHDYPDP